jgi:hypothetical protein
MEYSKPKRKNASRASYIQPGVHRDSKPELACQELLAGCSWLTMHFI